MYLKTKETQDISQRRGGFKAKTAGSLPAAENFQRRNRPYLWNRQVFDFSDAPQKVKPLAPLKQGTRGQIPAVPPKLAHKRPLYSRSYGLASNAAKRRAIFPPALMEPFAAQPAPRLTERGSLCRFASGTISNHRFYSKPFLTVCQVGTAGKLQISTWEARETDKENAHERCGDRNLVLFTKQS